MTSIYAGLESWILSYLLNSLWQVPLLFAAACISARAVRGAGVAAEHRVWVGALLLQAVLPACSTLSWNSLGLLWDRLVATSATGHAQVLVQIGPGAVLAGSPFSSFCLVALACAGATATLYFAARFAWRYAHLRVLRRAATPIAMSQALARPWQQCEAHFGVRGVVLARSAHIFAPVTIGLRRPMLLLPESMGDLLNEQDVLAILAHEFAHLRRKDFAKNLIYEVLALPLNYHPLLRTTRERLTETREMVCDDLATALTEPATYGRSLLRLASLLFHGTPAETSHAIGIFDANTLERRLMRLKNRKARLSKVRRFGLAAACAVMAVGISMSALAMSVHVDAAASATSGKGTAENPLKVSAGKMAANILTKTMPKYPAEAKKARIQGKVELRAIIDKEGRIDKLHVISGPKELQQSSLDAVRTWTYKPFLLNGKPVVVQTTINVTYSLVEPASPAHHSGPPPSSN